ncbi:unnamed protein product, partial [Laminaria digitata]
IAPFASIVRDPDAYERFGEVILTHTCREKAELQYGFDVVAAAKADILVGEDASEKLVHFASTTREETAHMGRITTLIETGGLFDALGEPPFDPEHDRVMICGSMAMLQDLKAIFEAKGFEEGANNKPGSFVIERAFVG